MVLDGCLHNTNQSKELPYYVDQALDNGVQAAHDIRAHHTLGVLMPPYCSARNRSNVSQNFASCVVAKLMRISVLGWRSAWNRAPGASR